jgi:predicted MFS family arabinose efflux permease
VAAVLEPTGQLREGNALLNMAMAPNMAIGGAIGALVAAGLGADVALMANAATFVVGSLLVGTARGLPRYDAPGEPEAEHWRVRLRAAAAYVRRHRTVFILLLGQSAALVFFAMTEPIEVVYTREALGAGPGGYGALIAAWGGGVLIGSFLYTWVGTQRLGMALALSTLLQGGAYLALGVAPDIGSACAIAVVGGVGNGAQIVAIATAIQEAVAIDFQARVMSMYEAVSTAAPGVGYLLGGAVAAAAGTGRAAFLVAGAGVFAVMAVVLAARPWRAGSAAVPVGETFTA